MRLKVIAATLAGTILFAAAAPAQRPGETYRALGNEPFWSVTIENGTIRFEQPDSRPLIVKAPIPRPSFNGLRYETSRITVDVTRSRCSDGMSDRVYPDSVQVIVGRRTFNGCGGAAISEARNPVEGWWRVRAIDGRRLRGPGATIAFNGNRITGDTGCNRFSGSFRMERDRLVAGPIATTRRACQGPAMKQEKDLLGLLAGRLTISRMTNGALVMAARNGHSMVLVPAER